MNTFYEFRVFFEVRECVHDLVTQVEIDAKDSMIEDLQKQILQLQQENKILEDANARYSSLQLIEANECSKLQQSFQCELSTIREELQKADLLEAEVTQCNEKLADMREKIKQSQHEIQDREEQIVILRKTIRMLQFAYMDAVAPSIPISEPLPQLLPLPSDVNIRLFSFLDSKSIHELCTVNMFWKSCYESSLQGETVPENRTSAFFSSNTTIARLRENVATLSTEKRDLEDVKKNMEISILDLNKQIAVFKEDIAKIKSELESAHNQMASDREVKYYLDENFTRISQELEYVV